MSYNPIRLEVFKHLFASVADEMGVVLRKASFSPNIKERRDFSCALFDAQGEMIAQAAHIPVHLGSMPLSVKAAIELFQGPEAVNNLAPGDVIILNDPYRGGTHLPDITLVTPIFVDTHGLQNSSDHFNGAQSLFGFVSSRAHHADVGGMTAGSMPIAREIYQEGLIIPPLKLFEQGKVNQPVINLILANVRTPEERAGDLMAQIAANQRGVNRMQELATRYGPGEVTLYMAELIAYTERMTRQLLKNLPDGVYSFTDYMDDDGIRDDADEHGVGEPIPITVSVTISGENASVDFSGSASQQPGSINAVYAISLSAVYYVFRCLIGLDVPNNAGCLKPIHVFAPQGSIVNAQRPAPVAGGNVETSQRIVDVLFGALAQVYPDRIPAASQGTMNNITIGGLSKKGTPFAYYETIGGGMGARPKSNGPAAVQSHMTNTLNTPIEALEYEYPLRILRYEVRRGSGGLGQYLGGDGIRRDIQLLVNAQVSLITERRKYRPYGLAGGEPGACGENILIRGEVEQELPSKGSLFVREGDIISIRTPGGGGFGFKEEES